jgi:GT2 family glycosyltransferase
MPKYTASPRPQETKSGNFDKVGMVINHYSKECTGPMRDLLAAATLMGVRFLKCCDDVGSIIVVDGSKEPDEPLSRDCKEIGATYFHTGREVGYSAAYNIGWRQLEEGYIGLMANDIIPNPPSSLSTMLEVLRDGDVGCVFPYLNSPRLKSDEVQAPGFLQRGDVSCEPSSMTLNLNLFKREVLEAIGGITEDYKVGFSEPILLMKIRGMGLRCVMVGKTRAYHCDRLTKLIGQSTLSKGRSEADVERWFREYPQYASRRGIAQINFSRWPYSTTRWIRWLWLLAYGFPIKRRRKRFMRFVMWLEPWLTRYPARYGRVSPSQ